MYLSKAFIPILKNNPSEAKIKSHQLMLRAGMIKQSSAGIYSWLPLGFKVMKKIEKIVREEQNKIGAHELLMPTYNQVKFGKKVVVMKIMEMKCYALKIVKIEKCYMALQMKN